MEFERRRRKNARIDLAPLVDIVFNLLLFFLITYSISLDPAIRVRLPESETADARAEEPIVISLTREGGVFLGDRPLSLGELAPALRADLSLLPERAVRIRADREAAVGLLVQLIDRVRQAGCSAFSVVTESP
ncbi:MAG: biopolymer transporter ExbD [Desulfobacterales bacterium]